MLRDDQRIEIESRIRRRAGGGAAHEQSAEHEQRQRQRQLRRDQRATHRDASGDPAADSLRPDPSATTADPAATAAAPATARTPASPACRTISVATSTVDVRRRIERQRDRQHRCHRRAPAAAPPTSRRPGRAAPPASDSIKPCTSSCRTMRERAPPTASRIAISFCRADPNASIMLARLRQEVSSTARRQSLQQRHRRPQLRVVLRAGADAQPAERPAPPDPGSCCRRDTPARGRRRRP